MKLFATFLFLILLIGCGGTETVPQPDSVEASFEGLSTVISTVAPATDVPATPVPVVTLEGYPAPTQPPVDAEGYPMPATLVPTISAYPVETTVPTETPAPEAIGSGLHYMDDTGVWRVTADGLTAQIAPLTGASTPILSPDGTTLAYILEGEPAVILLDTLSGQITSLTSTVRDVCCIFDWEGDTILAGVQDELGVGQNIGRLTAFSPDNTQTPVSDDLINGFPSFHPTGTRIAYSENGMMQIYNLTGERTSVEVSVVIDANREPLIVENLSFSTASWSPAAQIISWSVSFVQNGEFKLGIAILDLEDSSIQIFHPYTAVGMEYLASHSTWHPSQPLLAFETIDQDATQRGVWLLNYATGEEQFVLSGFSPKFSPDGAYLAFQHEAGIQIYTLDDGSFTTLPTGRIIDWR